MKRQHLWLAGVVAMVALVAAVNHLRTPRILTGQALVEHMQGGSWWRSTPSTPRPAQAPASRPTLPAPDLSPEGLPLEPLALSRTEREALGVAYFEKQCAKPLYAIHRKVYDVSGFLLLNVPRTPDIQDESDLFYPGAALYGEGGLHDRLQSLLLDEIPPSADQPPGRRILTTPPTEFAGYAWADALTTDGELWHAEFIKEPTYTPANTSVNFRRRMLNDPLAPMVNTVMTPMVTRLTESHALHTVRTHCPINDLERLVGVAHCVIQVHERRTGELLGEAQVWAKLKLTTNPLDWRHRRQCPPLPSGHHIRYFVDRVLIPPPRMETLLP